MCCIQSGKARLINAFVRYMLYMARFAREKICKNKATVMSIQHLLHRFGFQQTEMRSLSINAVVLKIETNEINTNMSQPDSDRHS